MSENSLRFRNPIAAIAAVVALVVTLLAPPRAGAQILIDSFATNQAALTLTYPPAGTSASSSVSGAGILGGERDMRINLTGGVIAGNTLSATVSSGFFSYSQDATIAGSTTLQWDGTDGSATLNPTGLGGVDLTQGGTQDALQLSVFFDDLPITVTVEVFTDAGNASTATFSLPGLVFASTNFIVPYSAFTTTLGTGANFANVGAIVLTAGSTVTAPDLVIDFLQTTALINATMTVADQSVHTPALPGDTLRYTVLVNNPTDATGASATGVKFASNAPANTTLVAGSVTTTQGTVTTGNGGSDTSVAVSLGTIEDGASVTVTFDVTINRPVTPPSTTQISAQGTLTSDTLTAGVTDDPGTATPNDPTVIAVQPLSTTTLTGQSLPPAASVGSALRDQATLAGGTNPTGTITFDLYAPGDTTCATSLFTTTTPVSGNGVYTSNPASPTGMGVYRWIAKYSGDAGNTASATLCNDPAQQVAVTGFVASVPTLSEWGLAALACLLATAGVVRTRRRLRG